MKKIPALFDAENDARKRVEFAGRKLPEVKAGEIWWYYVGINIGEEISKGFPYQRPCLVFSEVKNSSLLMIIPLSTRLHKKRISTSIELNHFHKYGLHKKSRLLLHQIQIVDKKRLQNKVIGKTIGKRFLTLIKNSMFI